MKNSSNEAKGPRSTPLLIVIMSLHLQHIDLNDIIVYVIDYSIVGSDMPRPRDIPTAPYTLVPIEEDDLGITPELQARIDKARAEIKAGNCKTLKSHADIDAYFNSL